MRTSGASLSWLGIWVLSPIVGLTGGIGSGKSAVARLFAAQGIPCVDTDVVSHQLTAAGGVAMPAIVATFGAGMQQADGALDRGAMRALVFSQPAARQQLEAILHPLIYQESQRQLAALDAPYRLLAVPLLFESTRYREVITRSLVVDCPTETQIARVMARNGLTEPQVCAIIAAQMPREQRLLLADDVISNDADLDALALQVIAKHRYYLACFGLATPA